MGDLRGWAIDLPSVYGRQWRNKEKYFLREDLFESPDKKTAGLLYGIMEIGVSKEIGRLAVFRDKEKPEMILNLPRWQCWYLYGSTVYFGKGNLLFIHCFESFTGRLAIKLCALDYGQRQWTYLDKLPEGFYDIRHNQETSYIFKSSQAKETTLDLKDCKWKSLDWWRPGRRWMPG